MPRRVYPDLAAFFRANPDVAGYQLAQELGCSPAYVSMIRWKERQPTLGLALKIAERCHIPIESLLRKVG